MVRAHRQLARTAARHGTAIGNDGDEHLSRGEGGRREVRHPCLCSWRAGGSGSDAGARGRRRQGHAQRRGRRPGGALPAAATARQRRHELQRMAHEEARWQRDSWGSAIGGPAPRVPGALTNEGGRRSSSGGGALDGQLGQALARAGEETQERELRWRMAWLGGDPTRSGGGEVARMGDGRRAPWL